MSYTSLQAIREMAGVQNQAVKEVPTGAANGSNQDFYCERLPLVDTQYQENGGLQTSDVIGYVNGVVSAVSAVVAATGKVTFTTAPANGADIEISFAYSSVTDTRVQQVRSEAESWVNSKLEGIVEYSGYGFGSCPQVLATIVDLYAAGLILIRDYGSSADTDLSSKDGYKKLETAQKMLKEYVADISDDAGSTSPTTITLVDNGQIFERNTDLTSGTETTQDREFFNKDN